MIPNKKEESGKVEGIKEAVVVDTGDKSKLKIGQ